MLIYLRNGRMKIMGFLKIPIRDCIQQSWLFSILNKFLQNHNIKIITSFELGKFTLVNKFMGITYLFFGADSGT